MKKFCRMISAALERIIGVLLSVCLFAGGLGFLGFVAAFIIGGESAAAVCQWLIGTYYAILVQIATGTTVLCFLLMYFNGTAKWKNPFKKKGTNQ